jgi:hypothetical protein
MLIITRPSSDRNKVLDFVDGQQFDIEEVTEGWKKKKES